MPEIHSFGIEPINCYCWNKERNQIALSLNSNEVQIQQLSGGKWNVTSTLVDHSQRVTGIDWSSKTNQIVTCATDRNAYAWTKQANGDWKPQLVVLGINRAATCVKWSPNGNKFALGSGSRSIAVCYFDAANDFWTNKKIKKPIRSTVTCIDWHPNNLVLSCGSTDFKARVYSAYMKEADESSVGSSWGSKMLFANMLAEFSSEGSGWIHGIKFSGNGEKLAWVAHNSSICIADSTNGNALTVVTTEYLPFMDVIWINATSIVVAGYDCSPMLFTYNGNAITFQNKLDANSKQNDTKKTGAMAHFKSIDSRATSSESSDTTLSSIHQNTITQLALHTGTADKCTKLSSSGADGQLIIWDVK